MTITLKFMIAMILLIGTVTLSACQKPQPSSNNVQFKNMDSQSGQNDEAPSSEVKIIDQMDETATATDPTSEIDQELKLMDQELNALQDTDVDGSDLTLEQLEVE